MNPLASTALAMASPSLIEAEAPAPGLRLVAQPQEELEPLSIPQQLLGASLVTQAQEASRYLGALESGDLQRLRRMLETSVMVGESWAVRLQKQKRR